MATSLERVTLGLVLACPVCLLHGQAAPRAAAPLQGQTSQIITLDEALRRAQANEPAFAAAVAAAKSAKLDRSIAHAALLPQVEYHNQVLYTQPNGAVNQAGSTGSQAAPKFIANDAVREYASQGVVTETAGFGRLTAVTRATAAEAIAQAELELSRRGLAATVLTLYLAVTATEQKAEVAQRAQAEASSFVTVTTEREAAREAAHADVIKAQLAQQQRQRETEDTQLEADKAKLELGVLLFADPRTGFTTAALPERALPGRAEMEAAARNNNPELRSALATLNADSLDVRAAREAYLPDLALGYTYGIDAQQFAVNGPGGVRNLGYSAQATLDIPVFDWFATRDRVRQAELTRDVAKVELSAAQRRLIADLESTYAEAAAADRQRTSLAQSAATAAESLRLTRLRYAAGESTVFEVIDAQNSLITAELARVDGATRYAAALSNLELLTGAF